MTKKTNTVRTIAVFNQAGGVGKTTTTRDLGYELAQQGFKTLLIDSDPQGSLSDFLGLEPFSKTIDDTFWGTACRQQSAGIEPGDQPEMKPVVYPAFGCDVGIANFFISNTEIELSKKADSGYLYRVLSDFGGGYDFILFDCPPSVHELINQILYAVDEILIPVQPEQKAVVGLAILQQEIVKANKRRRPFRPNLKVSGVIPTLYNPNRSIHKFYLNKISEFSTNLGYKLFPTIQDLIVVTEASNSRKPLKIYDPKCPVNAQVESIARILCEDNSL